MYDKIDPSTLDLKVKTINIARVSKTVKGGRKMKFSALVVVGNGEGIVGYGIGKSVEVPYAISKAEEDAKKNLVRVSLKGTTIPHELVSEYGSSMVVMKPAPEGTGVIAGGAVRAVLDAAGVKDIRTKALHSRNPKNLVKATIEGLASMKDAKEVAEIRGKTIREILG